MTQRVKPLTADDKAELRGAADEGVDAAELRAISARLLRGGCDPGELAAELDALGPPRRAMNDEAGEELIYQVMQEVLDGRLALATQGPPAARPGPVELESATGFRLAPDRRPMAWDPPPVSLVAVDDCRLPAPAGSEGRLDAFYGDLLRFQRDPAAEGVVYRAENFRLRFDFFEGRIDRLSLRPLGVVVRSLSEAREKLIESQIEHARQRGLNVGQDTLLLQDPVGNWVELTERRGV